jgi:chromosome segregation ATPase
VKNNNFKQFLAMLLCITLIPVTPIAYADEGSDSLKNSGEALGGLNFGGGAMTTELTGGSGFQRSKPYTPNDNKISRESSATSFRDHSSLAWLNPSALTKMKEKAKDKKAEDKTAQNDQKMSTNAVANSPTFSPTPSSNLSRIPMLASLKMNISSMIKAIKDNDEISASDPDDTAIFVDDEATEYFGTIDSIEESQGVIDADLMAMREELESEFPEEDEIKFDPILSLKRDEIKEAKVTASEEVIAVKMHVVAVEAIAEEATDIESPVDQEGGEWVAVYDWVKVPDPDLEAIAEFEAQIAKLESEKANLTSEIESLEALIKTLEDELKELDQKIKDLEAELKDLQDQLKNTNERLKEISTERAALVAEFQQKEAEWRALGERNYQINLIAQSLWAELHGSPRPTAARRKAIIAMRAALKKEFKENLKARKELKKRGFEILKELKDLNKEEKRLKAKKELLEKRIKGKKKAIDKLKERVQEIKDALIERKSELDSKKKRMKDIDDEIAKLKEAIEEAKKRTKLVWQIVSWKWVPNENNTETHSLDEPQTPTDPKIVDHSPENHLLTDEKEADIV